jgi:hypothetical protein
MRNGSFVMDFDPPQEMIAVLCYRVDDRVFYERLGDQIKHDIPGIISTHDWTSSQDRHLAIGTMTFQAQDPTDRDEVLKKVGTVLEQSGFRRLHP